MLQKSLLLYFQSIFQWFYPWDWLHKGSFGNLLFWIIGWTIEEALHVKGFLLSHQISLLALHFGLWCFFIHCCFALQPICMYVCMYVCIFSNYSMYVCIFSGYIYWLSLLMRLIPKCLIKNLYKSLLYYNIHDS